MNTRSAQEISILKNCGPPLAATQFRPYTTQLTRVAQTVVTLRLQYYDPVDIANLIGNPHIYYTFYPTIRIYNNLCPIYLLGQKYLCPGKNKDCL